VNPEWADAASDDLADIWVAATPDDRDEIERAVLRANRLLTDDPENEGESRPGNARVLIVPPLTVWYRVRPGPQARVFGVRRFRQRP
jgi:plasmid stabilization system protein ParE